MTFSEYFHALYPYLSDGEKQLDFFDVVIGHFIDEEAQEACELLNCKPDTKRRYIKETDPNKIKPEYAKYVHSKHNSDSYINWINDKMYAADAYDKIDEWLTNSGIEFNDVCVACDTLLADIFFAIAYPNAGGRSEVKIPEKTAVENTDSQQLAQSDQDLLKEFHVDFDSVLEKCIASDQAEVWFTSTLAAKIDKLYNEKWKDRIPEFSDLGLQADILSTIATLRDFCNALDPDSSSSPVTSVRRLRIKLRDNYVKIHPENYADMFPYDAFIDDWNDGNDFDMEL